MLRGGEHAFDILGRSCTQHGEGQSRLGDLEGVDAPLPGQGLDIPDAHVGEGDLGPPEVPAGVVPAPAGLLALLADVLADVAHSGVVVAVELQSGGEAQRPAGQVEDGVTLAVGVAAVHGGHSIVEEAVEVDGPVLVALGHQDIGQAMPPDLVVQPGIELAGDGGHIVAVHPGGVQGEGNEPAEGVCQGQIADLGPSPAHGAPRVRRGGRSVLTDLRGRWRPSGGPCGLAGHLPPHGVENGLVAGQDLHGTVGEGLDPGGFADAARGGGRAAQQGRDGQRFVNVGHAGACL